MRYYFDTSALCRYYHSEPGSLKVEQIVDEAGSEHVLSWLGVLETQSAFALKARTGVITPAEFGQLRKRLKADIARRRLLIVRMLRRHYDRAERLIVKYGLKRRLRSLDALHLGVALDLHEKGRVDMLVTADSLLDDVSQKEGLAVLNPLVP